jgi:hypothetical protein
VVHPIGLGRSVDAVQGEGKSALEKARPDLRSKLEAVIAPLAQVRGQGGGPGHCDPMSTANWREMVETGWGTKAGPWLRRQ